ncbi:hypothetical protein [Bowmanella dokdonensis]|uniref:Lipoprotein n=1 Tax=Bowmanella dokdonensis TaxID=751969 RepID=A0A939DL80_9ALTE|nr:hypothetical protein [Bowmanella dokdonensis]MBN7824604.1 hypothetical protein [Bowmanella dokdonensis]
MKTANRVKNVLLSGILLSVFVLGGCMKNHSFTARGLAEDSSHVSTVALKRVNQSFRTSFQMGDWYFQGAQVVNGGINAYIQIPAKLDMDRKYQENYLRQSVCPSAEQQELWHELGSTTLSVHIYTFSKRFSVHAECRNPLA